MLPYDVKFNILLPADNNPCVSLKLSVKTIFYIHEQTSLKKRYNIILRFLRPY